MKKDKKNKIDQKDVKKRRMFVKIQEKDVVKGVVVTVPGSNDIYVICRYFLDIMDGRDMCIVLPSDGVIGKFMTRDELTKHLNNKGFVISVKYTETVISDTFSLFEREKKSITPA